MRDAGLAGAAGTEHGGDAGPAQQGLDGGEIVVAAEQGIGGRAQSDRGGRPGRGRRRFGLAAQDCGVRLDEGGTGVGAELVGEAGAQCGEHVQRVGGVAEIGEGVHEREVRGLVERVALGAGLHQWQGAGEVAEGGAGGDLEIVERDSAHHGRRAEVAGEIAVGQVGAGVAAP